MVMRTPRPAKSPAKKNQAKKPASLPTVLAATNSLLAGLELNDAGNAKAAAARALARKLDACADKDPTGGDPTAGIAREWREIVDAILEATEDDGGFSDYLFSEMGNT